MEAEGPCQVAEAQLQEQDVVTSSPAGEGQQREEPSDDLSDVPTSPPNLGDQHAALKQEDEGPSTTSEPSAKRRRVVEGGTGVHPYAT